MSYLTKQTTQLRQAQVAEALLRMDKLKIHENAVNEFKENGKLNRSESAIVFGCRVGVLYWLTEEEEKMVREWEKDTGNLVYHVIKNHTGSEPCIPSCSSPKTLMIGRQTMRI